MMPKMLVVSFGPEALMYVRRSRLLGLDVRVLDCVDAYRRRLSRWFGKDVIQAAGHRHAVRAAVASESFDVALVQEDADFIRTALITQSLREAGVKTVIVVTNDAARPAMYRRCGAHQVVVAGSPEQAWLRVYRMLPSLASAS
ncbi:MAG: hypothetical protein K6T31_03655 [Alicyclobacillus sp.]|nr:hypothetical protein [Alicyclobacillus sp.]